MGASDKVTTLREGNGVTITNDNMGTPNPGDDLVRVTTADGGILRMGQGYAEVDFGNSAGGSVAVHTAALALNQAIDATQGMRTFTRADLMQLPPAETPSSGRGQGGHDVPG